MTVLRLPDTDSSLVIRTDYSSQADWLALRAKMEATNEEGFRAYVAYYDDPALDRRELSELLNLVASGQYRSFFFVVDAQAIADPEHPILVVDAQHEPGRTFRVIPSELFSVENNLDLANMDFHEFSDNADPVGVFRGFS